MSKENGQMPIERRCKSNLCARAIGTQEQLMRKSNSCARAIRAQDQLVHKSNLCARAIGAHNPSPSGDTCERQAF